MHFSFPSSPRFSLDFENWFETLVVFPFGLRKERRERVVRDALPVARLGIDSRDSSLFHTVVHIPYVTYIQAISSLYYPRTDR